MVHVIPNKNIIFFSTIVKTLSDELGESSYAKEIIKEFSFIKGYPVSKEFLKECDQMVLSKSIFPYLRFAIYSDSDLKPDEKKEGYYGYGSKSYELYKNNIYPLFAKIKEQSNFDNYYSESILPKYQKICSNINSILISKIIRKRYSISGNLFLNQN